MHNLFTGRLIRLRALEPSDAETLFRHHQDTEISRRDARIQWPRSLADIRRRLETPGEVQSTDNIELVITTLDDQVIGGIDVQSTDRRNGTFSIGIGLTERSAWGKGYAKEAMLLVLRAMFHEWRYQKCNISVYAFNTRALGLYRRLGFQEEGRLRRTYFSNGEYHDEICLGVTREEFDARYPEWRVSMTEDLADDTIRHE
ncbi:MAG TPA: GNAT family protein [Roseiflexaceae bacterium]|nr:GNAT family protein [Roseiflexaceae bacterium]